MAICRSCAASIDWVKLVSGKNHPVEGDYVNHDEARQGDRLITDGGNVVTVDITRSLPNIKGRLSHFASCPNANEHRRS